jgi:uncharacterized membrane protein YgcG
MPGTAGARDPPAVAARRHKIRVITMKTTNASLERQLTKLYKQVLPPPDGLAAGRERLLIEAARLQESSPALSGRSASRNVHVQRRPNVKLGLAYRLIAAVLAVIVGTAVMGGGTALVAADSLPGDILYPVKLAAEDAQLALAGSGAAQAGLYLDFAAARVAEMVELAGREKAIPDGVPARMARHTEQAMVQIAQARPEEAPALMERATERMRELKRILEEARSTASENSQLALGLALETTKRAEQALMAANGDPNRLRLEMQHRNEGTPGRHGTGTPTGTVTPSLEQNRTREQQRLTTTTPDGELNHEREQHQRGEPNGTPTPQQEQEQRRQQERAPSYGEQERVGTPTVTPTCTPADAASATQNQEREQEQRQSESEREGQQGPQATATPQQNRAPQDGAQERDRDGSGDGNQNQNQNGNQGQENGSSTESGGSGSGGSESGGSDSSSDGSGLGGDNSGGSGSGDSGSGGSEGGR